MNNFVVTEVVVEAQAKNWASGGPFRGDSGGSVFSWKVKPGKEIKFWTLEEARLVTLRVRKELQKLLVMDARARGIAEVEGDVEVLKSYDLAVDVLEKGVKRD